MVPPEKNPGRQGVALVAIVKDESRYIEEWAEFHHRAGIRHFFIYDNGSTDATECILRNCLPSEVLTLLPWKQTVGDARFRRSQIHNQVLAYAHAASNFGADYRWMAFIDVDEFLIPKKATSIPAALEPLGGCRNLSLPWHMYGTSGHRTDPGGSIVVNFRHRHRNPMTTEPGLCNFKCIVDPCHLTALRVHSMQTDNQAAWLSCNDRGEVFPAEKRSTEAFYSVDSLQLNHYYTRSENEFANKIGKGHIVHNRSNRYAEKLPAMLHKIDSDTLKDDSAVEFLQRIEAT